VAGICRIAGKSKRKSDGEYRYLQILFHSIALSLKIGFRWSGSVDSCRLAIRVREEKFGILFISREPGFVV
jgi:hypothetical protein